MEKGDKKFNGILYHFVGGGLKTDCKIEAEKLQAKGFQTKIVKGKTETWIIKGQLIPSEYRLYARKG